MNAKKIDPIHPGEILFEEFLKPMNLSQNRLAMDIRVPARRINEIVHGKRRISADTALRLGRFFDNSPQFWLGLQMDYDLDVAEDKLSDRLDQEIQPYAAWIGELVYLFTISPLKDRRSWDLQLLIRSNCHCQPAVLNAGVWATDASGF